MTTLSELKSRSEFIFKIGAVYGAEAVRVLRLSQQDY